MLTKSDYIKYIQCKKYLWLNKIRPELLPEDIGDNLKRAFEAGFEVEKIAYKLYPNGVDANEEDIERSKSKTRKLIKEKTPVIFQATVSGVKLFCRSDIIRYNEEIDGWDLIEVKSATEVKDIYIDDVTFQKICLEEAGVKVGRVLLIHVNNQYVKDGDINPNEFFIEVDVSEEVRDKIEETKIEIDNALEVLKIKEEPEIQVLRQCNNPYECPFIPYCWKDFPAHSIYSIAGALGKKKLEALLDEGILEVKDIPPEFLSTGRLKKHHYVVENNVVHIEKDNIKKEIESIEYPIYYLDYETFSPAIPIIDGYRPYQRVVFQYSLHIQESPNSELKHFYFLAKDSKDPTREMAKTLQERIGKDGTVIAWNMGFEQGCNTEMGERATEFKIFFEDVNNRMYDLMQIFKEGYYVHKEFHGSASLKKVLPVVVPELDYNKLDISEGMTASNTWGDMVTKDMTQAEKDKIYNDLLAYCELDTLAMVKILEKLNSL
ncbi:MAG: DUF2779 domain-containing protein [Patescibacteria group bacterium]|jgi:hypothetical protein